MRPDPFFAPLVNNQKILMPNRADALQSIKTTIETETIVNIKQQSKRRRQQQQQLCKICKFTKLISVKNNKQFVLPVNTEKWGGIKVYRQ